LETTFVNYNPAPYLRWAKVRPRVTHDLASSGLLPVTTAELLGDARARDAFEITGPSDEGFMPLREAIGARYGLTADHITIAPGAAGANFQSFLALLTPADEVLVETPGYDPLIAAVRALGARVVLFERKWENGFALEPAAIESALTPATRLIVISNAHNPSGAMAGAGTLREIGAIARKSGAMVLVDEVYAEAQHDNSAMPMPAATLGAEFVTTTSLTKAYGLAGLRCGWIVASPEVSERIRITRDVIDGSGAFIAESVAAIAVRDIDRLRERARKLLSQNFAVLKAMASSHPRLDWLEPVAGTTAFPRIRGIDDATPFVDALIRDYDTVVVPGHFFQAPAHIRIAFGGDPVKFRAALSQLDRALRELK
jgi:aspartate/methionine/tyrosine aminotransferase